MSKFNEIATATTICQPVDIVSGVDLQKINWKTCRLEWQADKHFAASDSGCEV